MKIMFFIQDLGFGGVLRQVSELVTSLGRKGHDISLVAMYPIDSNWQQLWNADSVNISTLFSRKPYTELPGPITIIKAVSRLRHIIMKEQTEILYSFAGNAAMLVSSLTVGTLSETKLIWGIRGSGNPLKLLSNDIKYKASLYILKCISPFVPLVIANSDAGLSFRQGIGHNFVKHLVIHNGFDTEKFKPDTGARNRLRQELGVSKKEILIGIAGRVVPDKGFHLFLKAAALILIERKGVRFVCVGDGDEAYKKRMALLSKDLGLDDRVIWTGFKEDMNSVFNALDILCSSSYGEGFPNVVGEAMACGVPCVVTDVGGSAKIVGDLGIVVPPGDTKMLAEGLLAMIERLPEIKPTRIRTRIVENFTPERMAEETETALRELLRGK
jgi:glycosyltransferase involved in cell wall biosynthesis